MCEDPYELASFAAERLSELTKVSRHDVLLVLGSGWSSAVEILGKADLEFPTTALPGFISSKVDGHAGILSSVKIGNIRLLVQIGRIHCYEGQGANAVVHGIRMAVASGVKTVFLTNASGSLNPSWKPGTAVLISDHINLTGVTPLVGARFLDVSEVYSKRLRGIAREIDPSLEEGVYVQFHGPQYETPAEVQMAKKIGGDLVGMSTALEAIAAKEAKAEVLGISLVTNYGAGLTKECLVHEEVLATGLAASSRMGNLLKKIIEKL